MTPLLAWLSADEVYVIVVGWSDLNRVLVVLSDGFVMSVALGGVKVIGPADPNWHAKHGASSPCGFRSEL